MNKKLDKEGLTLQDYYQDNHKLRLVDVSKLLNGYLVVSVITFFPMFFDGNSLLIGGPTLVAPLEFFLNICFPIGALVFFWCTKLALKTKEWQMFSFNLVKFVFPFLIAIKYHWFLDIEASSYSIWWLSIFL